MRSSFLRGMNHFKTMPGCRSDCPDIAYVCGNIALIAEMRFSRPFLCFPFAAQAVHVLLFRCMLAPDERFRAVAKQKHLFPYQAFHLVIHPWMVDVPMDDVLIGNLLNQDLHAQKAFNLI